MSDVLSQVLAYKQQKEAQNLADIQAIPQAVNTINAYQQQATKNRLDLLTNQISAAKSGLRVDPSTYNITPDESLISNSMQNLSIFDPTTGEISTQRIPKGQIRNTTTPEDVAAKETAKSFASYAGTKETAARAFDLRKEFQEYPQVKEYRTVKNQVDAMDSLLNNIDTDKSSALALDQGLITLFNKITDPNSVVRESEYERTPQNLSLVNRFSGSLEKLKNGGAGLTSEDRKALVFGAKVIADSRGKNYNDIYSRYKDLSNKFGVDPNLVLSGDQQHKSYIGENSNNSGSSQSVGKYKIVSVK